MARAACRRAGIGGARFSGTTREVTPSDEPRAVHPYRPTTFGVRLEHVGQPVIVGLGVSYAEPA
jgi:hypothetical protein